MSDLIEHLESHLGPIDSGWSKDADGQRMPFEVVLFKGGPISNTLTLVTLGLSKTQLRSRQSGKLIRHELVLIVRDGTGPRNLPRVVQELGQDLLLRGEAILRGDVIGPRGPLLEGS